MGMSRDHPLESIVRALQSELVSLRERVSVLESENRLLREENRTLREENCTLRAENSRLWEELTERETQLAARAPKNSSNSSKPPSSDHPHDPKSERGKGRDKPAADGKGGAGGEKPASERKRGGQRGHPGKTRDLAPESELQAIIDCVPIECARCQTPLPQAPTGDEPLAVREQVWELPPIKWDIREYRRHCRVCAECGRRTWGCRPPQAPTGCLGFRAQAAIGVLTGGAQLTRRVAQVLLQELLGLPLGLGTLSQVEARLAEALAPAGAEVAAAVAAAPVVNCDETPWRAPKEKPWLWVATTPTATCFRIARRRDADAFRDLLPARPGQIKGTDRYSVYTNGIPVEDHAICWGHLLRDFTAWTERAGPALQMAWRLRTLAQQLFGLWRDYRDGMLDRPLLWDRLEPVRTAMRETLDAGVASGIVKFTGLCANLLARWDALWTFARVEGVEPTNNAAERAVRQGVLWRKVSLFTQSERGRRYVERMLTVKTTLRCRKGNLLEFLTETLRAAQAGEPPPTLVAAAV